MTLDVPEPQGARFDPQGEPGASCAHWSTGRPTSGNPDVAYLDVRSDGELDRRQRPRATSGRAAYRAAVHVEWLDFLQDNPYKTFKEAGKLRSLLEQAGVPPDREVVTY